MEALLVINIMLDNPNKSQILELMAKIETNKEQNYHHFGFYL